MTASFFHVGHEFGAVTSNDSSTYETTTSGQFDAAFSRCGLLSVGAATNPKTAVFAAMTEGYVHYQIIHATSPAFPNTMFYLLSSSGSAEITLEYTANAVKIRYNNGVTFVDATGLASIRDGALCELDLYFKVNTSSGNIRLYSSGSLLLDSGTIDLSHIPNVAQVLFTGGPVTNAVSELAVSSEPTIGWRVGTLALTGAGTTNTFDSGTYADADEIVHSDADFLSSGTAAQIFTGATNDLAPGDYLIKGLAVTCRAKRGSSGPQNIQLAVRAGSTNYFSPTKALDVGYGAFVYVWELNPDTGIAWTEADIAAVEIGVKSIA